RRTTRRLPTLTMPQGVEYMRAADIPIDQDGALGLCRLLLRAAESSNSPTSELPVPAKQRPPTLGERFDRWIAQLRQRDRERYLSQSHDIFDLEARIRALDRRPYY